MHAAVQPGGRSPKPTNSSSSSQLKLTPEATHNSNTSFSQQVKVGKKRERNEQGSDFSKRERVSRIEDVDSGASKFEIMLRTEITKLTEKGGLPDSDAVEKLVHLMQLDRTERKLDISCRIMFADVISSTDRLDCLGRFVQLNGLVVLDEWLQEVHRGKSGDGRSPKDGDKSVEDLILALLRALDKLPVDLLALRSCNIGKSVNHLRGHKNMEIQKKSRSLVDTWKKRVDAEMTKITDIKPPVSCQPVMWPVKLGYGEPAQAGSQLRPSLSGEVAKETTSQSLTCKTVPSKPAHLDSALKSPATTRASKAVPSVFSTAVTASKDTKSVVGNSGVPDIPPTNVKEEKSSGSSQSCCSDHLKAVGSSWKEEARNASTSSINVSKASGITSRNKESNNGSLGTLPSGFQEETYTGGTLEKATESGFIGEGPSDLQSADYGCNKIIVGPSNLGHSPSDSTNIGSNSTPNGASFPGISDKFENNQKIKQRSDTFLAEAAMDASTGLWRGDDSKDGQLGSDKADGLCCNSTEEPKNSDEARGLTSLPKASCLDDGSKISSSCAAFPAGDAVGMNLLASVAAGEMSGFVSPSFERCGDSVTSSDHVKNIGLCAGDSELRNPRSGLLSDDKSYVVSLEQLASDDYKKDSSINFQKESRESYLKNERTPQEGVEQDFSSSAKDLKSSFEMYGSHGHRDEQKEIRGTVDNSLDAVDLTLEKSASGDGCANNGGYDSVACSPKTSKPKVQSQFYQCSSMEEKKLNSQDEGDGKSISGQLHKPLSSEIHYDISDRVLNNPVADSTTKELTSFAASVLDDHSSLVVVSESGDEDALERKESIAPCTSYISKNEESLPPLGECEQSTKLTSSNVTEVVVDDGVNMGFEGAVKIDFDLNGLPGEDENQIGLCLQPSQLCSSSITIPALPPFASPSIRSGSPAQVTVAAPAKGSFSPPESLLKSKGEPGWRGSAATSAFRPAEPRKAPETPSSSTIPSSNTSAAKPAFEIDLNIMDERVLEDAISQNAAPTTSESIDNGNQEATTQHIAGGLDLDLNRNDEASDNGPLFASSSINFETPLMPLKLAPRVLNHGEVGSSSRNFDLNGPGNDDTSELGIRIQHAKSNDISLFPQIASLRMNNTELGNISPMWFPGGSSYPIVPIPTLFPGRNEHPFAIEAPSSAQRLSGPGSFGDLYRHQLHLSPSSSSSPSSMAFSSTASFQYTGLPFSSRFRPGSSSSSLSGGSGAYLDPSLGGPCLPAVPSHVLGDATLISSSYVRPYLISLPETSTSGGTENSRRWSRQGLDLNTGPGSGEVVPVGSRAFPEGEAQLYQFSGSRGLKRKEPEGGAWDVDRFAYKQPSWQ